MYYLLDSRTLFCQRPFTPGGTHSTRVTSRHSPLGTRPSRRGTSHPRVPSSGRTSTRGNPCRCPRRGSPLRRGGRVGCLGARECTRTSQGAQIAFSSGEGDLPQQDRHPPRAVGRDGPRTRPCARLVSIPRCRGHPPHRSAVGRTRGLGRPAGPPWRPLPAHPVAHARHLRHRGPNAASYRSWGSCGPRPRRPVPLGTGVGAQWPFK